MRKAVFQTDRGGFILKVCFVEAVSTFEALVHQGISQHSKEFLESRRFVETKRSFRKGDFEGIWKGLLIYEDFSMKSCFGVECERVVTF